MKTEFLFAQTREQEYSHSSNKSDIKSVKKFVNFDLDRNEEILSENSDLEDQQERFANQDDEYAEYGRYAGNRRTGQRYEAQEFQDGKTYQNNNHQTSFGRDGRTIGFQGAKPLGQARPLPAASQFKEGQCSCCRQAHQISDCPKFKCLSNQQQSKIIRRGKLCYHCLEGPHLIKDCKTNEGKLCGKYGCKLYHHRVLHRNPYCDLFTENMSTEYNRKSN
jgi:hypothetical protein